MPSNSIYPFGKLPKYCVYLTVYSGNKMPMFYIGSTSINKVEKGYRGSVTSKKYKNIWKSEIKENPHLFKTRIILKTFSRKFARFKENFLQKQLNVVSSEIYVNMAFANGCFGLSGKDNPFFGKKHSTEALQKISISSSGRKSGFFGKKHTKESKQKISLSKIGKPIPKRKENPGRKTKIGIFDELGVVRFVCFGNFQQTCEENGLPFSSLRRSLYSSIPLYIKEEPKDENNIKYKGWFAKHIKD